MPRYQSGKQFPHFFIEIRLNIAVEGSLSVLPTEVEKELEERLIVGVELKRVHVVVGKLESQRRDEDSLIQIDGSNLKVDGKMRKLETFLDILSNELFVKLVADDFA